MLVLFLACMTWLVLDSDGSVLQPLLNKLLRSHGVAYKWVLWAEVNMDLFTHGVGSFLIMLLLYGSRLPGIDDRKDKLFIYSCLVLLMVFLAEVAQGVIGRGFSVRDIVTGAIGLMIAVGLIMILRKRTVSHGSFSR